MFTDPTGLLLQKRDNGFMIDKDEPRDAEIKKEKAEVSEKYGSMTALERWEYHQKLKQDGLGGRWITRKVLTAWNGGAWSQWLDDIRWVPDPRPTEAASGDQEVVAAIMEEELDNTTIDDGYSVTDKRHGRVNSKQAFGTNDGPCVFRSLIAMAETWVGKNLSVQDLRDAFSELSSGDTPAVDGGAVKATKKYFVYDKIRIVNWALKRLYELYKQDGVKLYIADETIKKLAQASIVTGWVTGAYTGLHTVEGDKFGDPRWDPSSQNRQGDYFSDEKGKLPKPVYYNFKEAL